MPQAHRTAISGSAPRPHPASRQGSRRRQALGALAVTGLLALTGCGGSDDSETSAADNAGEAAAPGFNGAGAPGATVDRNVNGAVQAQMTATTVPALATEDAKTAQQPGTPAVAALQPVDIGRSIIFTATLSIEVDNVMAASDQALTAVAGVGGFLYGQQGSSNGTPTNVLTFKVAPKDFQETLRRLGGLGRLADQQITSDDVTERLIDLESRIRAAAVSVERLRAFVAEAGDVNTLAALERELLQRETDLETLRGQQRGMEVQVDLATITLTLTQLAPDGPALELTVTAYAGDDEEVTTCPGEDVLRITEGDSITVCYEIRNTGSLTLTELRLDDPGLNLSRDEIRVVDGDLNLPLAPDQSVVLAASVPANQEQAPAPRLRTIAVDDAGVAVRTQVATAVVGPELTVEADTSVPGFVTSFTRGLGALVAFLQVMIMLVGALLPFAWVPVGGFFLVRFLRARKLRRYARRGPYAGPPPAGGQWTSGPAQPGSGPPPPPAATSTVDPSAVEAEAGGSVPKGDPQPVGAAGAAAGSSGSAGAGSGSAGAGSGSGTAPRR